MKIQPWYTYLAEKISYPIANKLSAFAKLGAGYVRFKATALSYQDSTPNLIFTNYIQDNVVPMAGLGLAYNLTNNIYIAGQWLCFISKVQGSIIETSNPNIFLMDIGYKFSV